MRYTVLLLLVIALFVASVAAVPLDLESQQENYENEGKESNGGGGFRSWTALKNILRPHIKWAQEELPKKTPSDVAKDITDTVTDMKEMAEESKIVKALGKAMQPLFDWFKGAAKTIKDKTFSDMYEDSKTAVKSVDDKVGDWLNTKTGN